MSAPSPCYVTQTPQREFAGAKLLQKFEICKYIKQKCKILEKIFAQFRKKLYLCCKFYF